jgi:ABC-type multidrug transport system fused ATPase/permease subunit
MMEELKEKTRILVTHQLHFLPQVDFIYVMKNGVIAEQGTFDELVSAGGEFSVLMETFDVKESSEEESVESHGTLENNKELKALLDDHKLNARETMQKEDRTTGTVKASIWKTYFFAAGGRFFLLNIILSLVLMQFFRVGSDYWLVFWQRRDFADLSLAGYILIYFSWGAGFALSMGIFGLILAYGGVNAGKNLHSAAITRLVSAPTSFFDSTPLGRIINRFSKDQDAVDNTMIESFRMFLVQFSNTITAFILIEVSTPWFIVPLAPILCAYYIVQNRYRSVSRELKRLDSIRRSPLYALLGETLNGLPTIRAYREESRFISRNYALINSSLSPTFLLNSAGRWLGIRFEILGAALLFFCAWFGIIARGTISPAVLGLALSYAAQVTTALNWAIRQFTETEIAMNAVERLAYYSYDIEQEAEHVVESNRTPSGWPSAGAIEFKDLSMKYAEDLPEVLKKISFSIGAHEKVGIVGRTGSGKSSMMQVLFRMVEPCGGSIIIDGVDITKIGLHDLRGPLGIIPQDPILFSGTFRSNLDPFGEYSDDQLWDAVDRAYIKTKVQECGGLDAIVMSGGENLSVGQRQLLCLARSILANPKILVLDEATANVDFDSDAAIQTCIRRDFKNSTVLTIAHRINTVMDYDKICVLDKGNVVEFGTPSELMEIENGIFKGLALESNNS